MAILVKGTDFSTGQQVAAANLDNLVDAATFDSGAVDNSTTQLSSGAIIVKDGGVTPAKLSTGAPTWDSSGNQTVTGRIDANGGTVRFPATQVPSSGANDLDDYEEGTWTPSVGGTATYTLQQGIYTKIGRLVHVHCRLTINSIGTGSQTTISGLPFTAAVATAGVVPFFASAANSFTSVGCYTSGTTIIMSGLTAAGASTATATFFTSSTDVMLSITYHV